MEISSGNLSSATTNDTFRRIATKWFPIGIFISSLLLSPFILDFTLTPRLIASAVVLLTLTIYLSFINFSFSLAVTFPVLAYSAFTLWVIFSVTWSLNKSEALFSACKHTLGYFIFLTSLKLIGRDREAFLRSLYKAALGISFILVAVVIIQVVIYGALDKQSLYIVTGLNGHKNLCASFLFLMLFFQLSLWSDRDKPLRNVSRLMVFLTIGLLLFLRTKAVWFGLLSALALYFSLRKTRGSFSSPMTRIVTPGVFFTFTFCLAIACLPWLTDEMLNGRLKFLAFDTERLVVWQKTFHMIRHHFLTGTGAGNWQIFFPDATLTGLWRVEDLNYTFQRPHNDLLWIFSEYGVVGVLLFFLFISSIFVNLGRQRVSEGFDPVLLFSFLAGYYVISFFDFPMERTEHMMWMSVLLALGASYSSGERKLFRFQIGAGILFPAALLLIFIIVVVSLRYHGEAVTRRMYDNKQKNKVVNVIDDGAKAESFAYTLDPTSVPIRWYTGNAHAAQGEFENAHRDFLRAYKLNPYNRNVLNDLGSSYAMLKETETAKKFYREAARISPRFDDPKLNLATLFIQEKQADSASFWLKQLYHDSERRTRCEKAVELISKK